ncbi:MAG: hypothetical protein QXL35_04395 [Candidatus Bathyarchaeia archaeon]
MDDPGLDDRLAAELGVEPKEILKAKLRDYTREIAPDELNAILATTVKRDEAAKLITFLGMLLAQTEEDQYNIAFQAESSTGKSYIPLEIAAYFPEAEKRIYAGASPTSFFHEVGEWRDLSRLAEEMDLTGLFDAEELADQRRRAILVDLEHKILIFLDQPHWMLMERLRPLLSHDRRLLRYSITDKTEKGGLRTKTVIIRGYPAAIFATTKPTQEDQERTRMWLLSPEAGQGKLRESLELLGMRIAHREAFREWLEGHPMRRWLMERIRLIRGSGIRDVIIPGWQRILERYRRDRPHLSPRSQRDWPRLLYLIKGFALLNCFNRAKAGGHSIIAEQRDADAAFALYDRISRPNELGLSPETYRIYEEVILPLAKSGQGVSRKQILECHFALYHRPLPEDRLRRQILPALESAGLIGQEPNPADRREMLLYPTVLSPIPPSPENGGWNGGVMGGRIQSGPSEPSRIPDQAGSAFGESAAEGGAAEERRAALEALRAIKGPFSRDYAEDMIAEAIGDREKARVWLERLEREGLLARGPDGVWRWIA